MVNINKKKGRTPLLNKILLQFYQMMKCVAPWLEVLKLLRRTVYQMVTRKVMAVRLRNSKDMHLIKVPRENYLMQSLCHKEKYRTRGPLLISKMIIWKPMQRLQVCNKQVVSSNELEDRPKKVSSSNVKQKCSVLSRARLENSKTIEVLNHQTQVMQVISNS